MILKELSHIKREVNNPVFYHDIFGVENVRATDDGRKMSAELVKRGMGAVIA